MNTPTNNGESKRVRSLAVTTVLSGTIVALAVIVAVTVLGLNGAIDAASITAIFGAIVGAIGGGAGGLIAARRVNGESAE